MKLNLKFYRLLPLYLSLLALIATSGLGIGRGLMALQLYTPANPDQIDLALSISAAVTVLGVLVYALLAPDEVRRFLNRRQTRYGSNALVMSVAFLGILFVANYLAYQNPRDLADLTEDKQNTLAPETLKAFQALPAQVTATAYYSPQMPRDRAQQLLQNLKNHSNGRFDYRFVDPITNPVAAREAGVTGDGKIVLEMNNRREIADYADESEILRALNRLINPQAHTVYFVSGHGEMDIHGFGQTALSRARETLENKNYTVKTLNLLADNRVPEDASVVIVAGPMKPLTQTEVDLLNQFTDRGGGVIAMLAPVPLTDFGDQADPLTESLEQKWGIRLRNDFIVDTSSTMPQNAIGVVSSAHPITDGMTFLTIFPLARSIELKQETLSEAIALTPLVQTSPTSTAWGETDFSVLKTQQAQVSLDPEDTPGPLILAAAAENLSTQGRLVVFGNAIFASDEGFDVYGNGDLFVNAVDWAANVDKDTTIDITPRPSLERTFVPPSQWQWLAILLGSVCGLPGLVVAGGIATWIARRRRG